MGHCRATRARPQSQSRRSRNCSVLGDVTNTQRPPVACARRPRFVVPRHRTITATYRGLNKKRRSRCRERNTATVAKYCVTIWAQWHYSDTRTKPAVREANCSPRPRKEANRQSSSLPYAGSKNTCRRRGGVVRMSSDKPRRRQNQCQPSS